MTLDAFPIVSLRKFETADAGGRKTLALEVDAICRTTGFLAIADHCVPQPTIDTAWNAAKDFFDEPVEVKQVARRHIQATPTAISVRTRRRSPPRAAWRHRPT